MIDRNNIKKKYFHLMQIENLEGVLGREDLYNASSNKIELEFNTMLVVEGNSRLMEKLNEKNILIKKEMEKTLRACIEEEIATIMEAVK